MDTKDIRILKSIAKLETGSAEQIAAETDIPKSTVHYRLDSLREEGMVTNDLFDLDLEKLGLDITVITEVWADYDEEYHDQVGEKLREIEGVNQVYFTMGDTDFVLISRLPSRDMIERVVRQFEAIDEVNRTSSIFTIKTIKDENRPLNDFALETLLRELQLPLEPSG
ncbi:Lrp/AsnC family transcriptional regulator [Natronosalvus halobius]|uniref:Lrp/AsnC family transcriptional regulator n=1 Tax=Natronosalvus halobius TaxID=2953746 RepID=UPI00209F887A|nr:Lrp/AsnC family transcriptional regulator [Natronosalvus halobius]USZ73720.1 Lrp/AsnC family transcriptional regulator [Natronosalvus halobius]